MQKLRATKLYEEKNNTHNKIKTKYEAAHGLDFGLVKSFTPEKPKEDDDVDRTGLTQAGVLLGSPLYMAPEQARGEADPTMSCRDCS